VDCGRAAGSEARPRFTPLRFPPRRACVCPLIATSWKGRHALLLARRRLRLCSAPAYFNLGPPITRALVDAPALAPSPAVRVVRPGSALTWLEFNHRNQRKAALRLGDAPDFQTLASVTHYCSLTPWVARLIVTCSEFVFLGSDPSTAQVLHFFRWCFAL